eukprot:Plantae.Rhodophyta-Hildenbrandia_rubra.ctg46245.p1 GENE.Plantae.Rhodophyta-Hildenbrandia_rubra.ctg46245~~Plantae.Rhodophyta-Hildenbrandia_rubra.ctg46245.p1  ORF type:complete len:445 (-),score=34.76 Plantae.Rhodophyta-Hildenbrandia_rubra.ctg46245:142-1476(-)
MQDDFLGGVVEGFYGQPWTHDQRLLLFDQMTEWRLNTYFYSPKDDLKHRAAWRESYDDVEISRLHDLVRACRERDLHFIYGLSPGLDIRFAESTELEHIQRRFQQMIDQGVQHFALLFDDLPGKMTDADRKRFSSIAAAQASVANATYEWLHAGDSNSRLLFCPTPYCDRMVKWKLGGENYLETIGTDLTLEIDVLWTGPEIISRDISTTLLEPVIKKIRRKPIIWDNLHANDYDLRRLYCGPYDRSPDLRASVRGILSNPNNEFPINFIPLRTLGEFLHDESYEPRKAFVQAARDWAKSYQTIKDRVSEEDVILLADCFYLPYSEGDNASQLKQCVSTLLHDPVDGWADAYTEFREYHQRILRIFEQLTQLHDRELFYAWSRRIWELREELDLIQDFVDAKRSAKLTSEGFRSETHLPGTCRGGMVADLQRQLLMVDGRFQTR